MKCFFRLFFSVCFLKTANLFEPEFLLSKRNPNLTRKNRELSLTMSSNRLYSPIPRQLESDKEKEFADDMKITADEEEKYEYVLMTLRGQNINSLKGLVDGCQKELDKVQASIYDEMSGIRFAIAHQSRIQAEKINKVLKFQRIG